MLGRQVVRLRPVGVGVVQLPGVVGERRQRRHYPRRRVTGDRGPALVVDAAVAEHLEVLRLAPLGRGRVVEAVAHAHALDRLLLDAVHRASAPAGRRPRAPSARRRSRGGTGCGPRPSPGCRSASGRSCRCACRPSARRPASSTGTACPSRAPSRPRSGCTPSACRTRRSAHAMNSAVSSSAAPLRRNSSLKLPLTGALGAGAVVADDVVDQRVVEHAEVLERVDEPPDVVVGVLEEAGVDLHLPGQHRLEVVRHLVPGGDLLGPARSARPRAGSRRAPSGARRSPRAARPSPGRSCPCTSSDHSARHVVRRMRGAGREVDEERLVGHQRLLLPDPPDRLVGHVLGEVVALLRRLGRARPASSPRRAPGSTGSSPRR